MGNLCVGVYAINSHKAILVTFRDFSISVEYEQEWIEKVDLSNFGDLLKLIYNRNPVIKA
jgi:hypothetical protein